MGMTLGHKLCKALGYCLPGRPPFIVRWETEPPNPPWTKRPRMVLVIRVLFPCRRALHEWADRIIATGEEG